MDFQRQSLQSALHNRRNGTRKDSSRLPPASPRHSLNMSIPRTTSNSCEGATWTDLMVHPPWSIGMRARRTRDPSYRCAWQTWQTLKSVEERWQRWLFRERWMRSERKGEDIFGCIPQRRADPSWFCPIYRCQCGKAYKEKLLCVTSLNRQEIYSPLRRILCLRQTKTESSSCTSSRKRAMKYIVPLYIPQTVTETPPFLEATTSHPLGNRFSSSTSILHPF